MFVREALGRAVGGILAPAAMEVALVRGAPVFHAHGVVIRAEVTPVEAPEPLGALGEALGGPALVRFSGALQRHQEGRDLPDVFGAAVRFRAGSNSTARDPQDLLFATFRHVWELPIAALRTDPRDFLANTYSTVLPFHVPGTSVLFVFRLVPETRSPEGRDHVERLEKAVQKGRAVVHLEARPEGGRAPYTPIASIALRSMVTPTPDETALRFNPFHVGSGVVPAGFFQAMRAAVYPASMLGAALSRGRAG
jgi:hypothetical protein